MTEKDFSYEEFCQYIPVPRETYFKLSDYLALVEKWQQTINLVSSTTFKHMWTRHVIDSAQLYRYIESQGPVVDLGSGAGFPGLVLAVMGIKDMTLIESDIRKSVFLKEAARVTGATVTIRNSRAESIDLKYYSILVARGFARLASLLHTIQSTLTSAHRLLLLKGKGFISEISECQEKWHFDYKIIPSITDSQSAIIEIQQIRKREAL